MALCDKTYSRAATSTKLVEALNTLTLVNQNIIAFIEVKKEGQELKMKTKSKKNKESTVVEESTHDLKVKKRKSKKSKMESDELSTETKPIVYTEEGHVTKKEKKSKRKKLKGGL